MHQYLQTELVQGPKKVQILFFQSRVTSSLPTVKTYPEPIRLARSPFDTLSGLNYGRFDNNEEDRGYETELNFNDVFTTTWFGAWFILITGVMILMIKNRMEFTKQALANQPTKKYGH